MGNFDSDQATTTNFSGKVQDYSVSSQTLDKENINGKTYWDFKEAAEQLGHYKKIPELKKAIDALATWTVGKGYTANSATEPILKRLRGWGEDSFQSIMWNLIVQKKIYGNAFAEIITNDEGTIINVKPLDTADMRIEVQDGIITQYEQKSPSKNGKNKKFTPDQILHLVNDRIGNEIHGVSVIDACKWVIEARNEALNDERKIKHRELSLGIAYYDTDDDGKISYINSQIEKAVKNGEMLGLPKDAVEIKEAPTRSAGDKLQWIQYLENFFYQAVGVPRIIATSEGFTEAGGKVGYLTFEPIYTREQTDLESDLFNQLAWTVKFNRPPSLSGVVQQDEQKNTGQTGIQQNEVTASATRTE